jgi:2-methylisocitrate lyase-like PEP mutase family enzyme
MGATPHDKALRFRELHQRPEAFVIANPWDAGSAKLLAQLGFEALATSSGASAAALGKRDGELSRDEALAHARAIVAATDLPVAADLENGFGAAPADAALTIRLAGEAGLVGGSIEDASGDRDHPVYDIGHAAERIAAAAEAARALPFPFVLTARSENFLRGRTDLADTIRRLQAFEAAGADVLFAPGLPTLDAVREVCAAVGKPVNYMIGMPGCSFSIAELQAAGVKRISLATSLSLYRVAMAAMRAAATEIREQGTFSYVDRR